MARLLGSLVIGFVLACTAAGIVVATSDVVRSSRPDRSDEDVPPDFTGHREIVEGITAVEPPQGQVATSPAGVVEFNGYTSIQVNVNADGLNIIGDAANEPSIAVDPVSPSRLTVGWRQFNTITSNFRQSGYGYSQDGGHTWTFPGVLEPLVFSSDPVLESDADGRFYYYALQPDRGPGDWACYLYASDDGGLSWPQEVYAYGGDKQWFAIDKTSGIGRGHLYLKWNSSFGCCNADNFTRSTNGGASFMFPIQVPQNPRSGTLTIDRNGRLFVAGACGNSPICVARSTNAQNASQTPAFELVTPVDLGGPIAFGAGPNPGGLLGQVWIDSDHSNSATAGYLYLLASANPAGADPLDIMFSRSEDGGATWSTPLRINTDPPAGHAWQWFGTMSVAPNGRIDVIWNDTRADATVTFSQLYYASSMNGGETWTENTPVSPTFNHGLGYPNQDKLGDYYDMESDLSGVNIAYAATFNGEQDVYFLRIGDFDCNANGFSDVDDIAEKRSDDCDGNSVPDECDPDCNGNELVDACETRDLLAPDCNNNRRPDECDPDFDADEVPDACDDDIDGDGVANASDLCDFTPPGLPVQSNGIGIGDHSRNCIVDSADLIRMMQCAAVGGPDQFVISFCSATFDFDRDGDLDLHDLAGIFRYYGR